MPMPRPEGDSSNNGRWMVGIRFLQTLREKNQDRRGWKFKKGLIDGSD